MIIEIIRNLHATLFSRRVLGATKTDVVAYTGHAAAFSVHGKPFLLIAASDLELKHATDCFVSAVPLRGTHINHVAVMRSSDIVFADTGWSTWKEPQPTDFDQDDEL